MSDYDHGPQVLSDLLAQQRQLTAKLARAHKAPDEAKLLRLRQDLAALRAQIALRKILDPAPPLRPEQAERLARFVTSRVEVPV